ncbi:MAG: hypothetical protein KAV87_58190 [Desulfobacteraceae bacterium]|nr:hypothetical protein [Desulfobacteraceae bacterium]
MVEQFSPAKKLKEVPVEDLGGGLNQAFPPNDIPIRECLICENTRVGEDGKSKEKRPGLTKLDLIYDFASKKIFGAFGIEESDEVKIAAFLEDDIQLKSGNEWGSIFSPTKTIDKPVSVVQDKGLVLVAGYEKLITIKDGLANYSGIEAPLTAPTVGTGAAGADKKLAEYATSNQDNCGELGQAAGQTFLAQSFKVPVDCELSKITLKLRKVGSPTGNIWVEIHESKLGTSATKNASPNINGQATDNLDVSTIRGSFAELEDTSIAFVSATKKITDSNSGLAGFVTGDTIKVSGSAHNDGFYTIATGGVAGEIVVTEDLIEETAGDSIKIETVYRLTFSGTAPDLDADKTYYLVIYRDATFSISSTNFIVVAFDNSSPEYEDGKYWEIDGSLDWGGYNAVDLVFEIHGENKEEQTLAAFGPLETGSYWGLRSDEDNYLVSQSFKLEKTSELTKVKVPLKRIRPMTAATLWVEIHSSNVGTSETKEASTNIVGQASDEVGRADLPEEFTWIEFEFSGTKPSLTKYETYVDSTSIAAQKVLSVQSTANFIVGGTVIIGEGTERKEIKVIGSIQAGVSLTMTEDLGYAHTIDQEDLVENSYYLVLYTTGFIPPRSELPYVNWTKHSGYEDGQPWDIAEAMSWTKLLGDLSFEILGYEISETKLLEYELSNLDDIKELREVSGTTLMAQEFLVYEDTDVTKVKLYLSKVGSLAGKKVWAEIHSGHGGMSETINLSDEIVGEGSDKEDADALSAFPTYGWVTFTFSGVKPSIEADKTYWIVIYGDSTISSTNYVRVGMDKIDPTYTIGKRWDIDDQLDWTAREDVDIIFELYTLISDVLGDYTYVITYLRWGNYPCESNPSAPSLSVEITSGNVANLTNIPVSSEPEVTHKNIYRNKEGEEERYWVERILNSVTTYDDSLPDSGLGDEVSYESYPPPLGDSIEIWDDCLWVCGVEGYPESLFRSRRGYLEQFKSIALSIFPLREDEASPVLRVKEFNNYLYPIKKTSIWVISRSGTALVADKLVYGKGTCAGASVAECGDKKLRMLSNYYEIEEFDGWKLTTMELPNKVKRVLKTINKTYAHRSVARNHEEENEYRLAIPTGSSMVPNKLIVYNYKDKNFFIDTYHQNICSISVLAIEKGVRGMLYGTDQGELYKVDVDATTDDGQFINMRWRTGWIGSQQWMKLRRIWLDFILPANKVLIFKVYSNFRDTAELTVSLSGSTPTGADPELRNVIHERIDLSAKGSFFSLEFINTEDVGDLLRVIKFWLYLKTQPGRRTISAE